MNIFLTHANSSSRDNFFISSFPLFGGTILSGCISSIFVISSLPVTKVICKKNEKYYQQQQQQGKNYPLMLLLLYCYCSYLLLVWNNSTRGSGIIPVGSCNFSTNGRRILKLMRGELQVKLKKTRVVKKTGIAIFIETTSAR